MRERYTGAIGYLDRIAECNNGDTGRYRSWRVGGRPAGFVRRDRVDWLLAASPSFRRAADGLELTAADFDSRSQAVAAVADRLLRDGVLRELRGEFYPVLRALSETPLLQIDRAAVPWFGVRPFGVHLNGYVTRSDGPWLWIAERARGRTAFPGCLDNVVAGGQPIGLGLTANLAKECQEEAGIPPALAARAVAAGAVTYLREDDLGLKPDTLCCFDLELPAAFTPQNNDGEVERFHLLPAREVAAVVRDTRRFKPNCNLVVIDFLLRHGLLDAELDPGQRRHLRGALRAPLP